MTRESDRGDVKRSDPPEEERRNYLKTVGALVAGLAIGGAAGWLSKPAERVEVPGATVTAPGVTETVTKTFTAPITTTVYAPRVYPTVAEELKAFREEHRSNILTKLMDEAKKAAIDWKQFAGTRITTCIRTGPESDIYLTLTKMFEELSGITVEVDIVPETPQIEKVMADILEETGLYDTPWIDSLRPVPYVEAHKLEPLDPYIEDPKLTDKEFFKPEDFYPEYLRAMNVPPYGEKNMHYYIPLYWHSSQIHWRKDIFDENGFSIEDIGSFYDLVEVSEKLNKPDKGFYGFATRGVVGESAVMYAFPPWLLGMGADYLDEDYRPAFNTPEGLEALKLFVKIFENAPPGAPGYHFPEILTALAENKVAMTQDVEFMSALCWDPATAKPPALANVWMSRIPKGPAGRFAQLSGWTHCIPVGAKNKKAAWLWTQFICSPLGTAAVTSYLQLPPRPSIWEDPDYAALLPPTNYKEIKQFTMKFDSHYGDILAQRVPEGPEAGYAMSEAVNAAITKTMTPEEAFAIAEERVKEIMHKAGYY